MISEYALEPVLLNNWKDFRYLVEKFGVSEGRLIARYPKHWKRLVYESLKDCSVMDKKRIVEMLITIEDRMKRRKSEWDKHLQWLENAEAEDKSRPFRAIIAKENPRGSLHVLELESLSEANPQWKSVRCRIIKRSADEIRSSAATLVEISNKVLIIDPYFSPDKIECRRPIAAIMESGMIRDGGEKIFEVHLKDRDNAISPDLLKKSCDTKLAPIIPMGMRLRVLLWREKENGEKLHNRYILTERGGIRFGAGISEDSSHTDEVELMDDLSARDRFDKYSLGEPAFIPMADFEILGRKNKS